MAAPVIAVDVEDKREEVGQQQEDVQDEQRDLREEQRDVLKVQSDEQKDVTEERKDVMEEKQDVTDARKELAQTHRAKTVIGMDVKNSQGESLGKIHDLVLNFDNGDIGYAVISSGGMLGIGDTLHAVPWKALSLNSQANGFILNIDRTAWKNAPSFKDNDWPEVADREWNRQLESYYR